MIASEHPNQITAPRGERRRVTLLMNHKAGSLLGRADAEATFADLLGAGAGMAITVIPLDAGTLPERVAKAVETGPDMIVVAGGDGTIACAAQSLADTGIALGILPSGTMNLLAKDLGIPIDDPAAAVQVLVEGHVRDIDVAEVNGRVFLCGSMLGLPARLGRHRERQRGSDSLIGGWLRFAYATLRAIRRRSSRAMRLQIGARVRVVRTSSLTIVANTLADRSARLFGRTRLDGGELGVYVLRRLGPLSLLRLAGGLLLGRWRDQHLVSEYRTAELVVESRRAAIRVMNDGEGLLLQPPLRYRIRPRALRVVAPPLTADAAR